MRIWSDGRMGKIERIQVSPVDRDRLHRLVKDRNTLQKVVWRAQIVLAAGDCMGSVAIAAAVGKSVLTVRRWRRRYAKAGVEGTVEGKRIRRGTFKSIAELESAIMH